MKFYNKILQSSLFFFLIFLPFFIYAAPPPAKEVFQLSAKKIDANTLILTWTIKKGYYLYKDRFNLIAAPDSNFQLGELRFPPAEKQLDSLGKSFYIYRNQMTLVAPILGEAPGEALLDAHYQGCSEDGYCYPPQVCQVKLTINNHLELSNVSVEEALASPTALESSSPEEMDISHLFSGSWGFIILSFFGFGLLLSFTPCILPMIPVLSGIIIGHGKKISTRKAFLLSFSYVFSMSITYSIIGGVVALLGKNLQIIMQAPWMIGVFSFIFVLLALSMFGVYELKLPVTWQNKLASVTRSQSGGHYLGSALMGALSILILSPCITPPLIGALSYIAQTGNVALGSIALFFLSLGMGFPLLIIGTSAGKLLPHAGNWMNAVKNFFGVLLLGIAIYLLERILPPIFTMLLWALLLIFTGVYLQPFTKAKSHMDRFRQGSGIILFVYGLFILFGASLGNNNPLQPLEGLTKPSLVSKQQPHVVVKSINEFKTALQEALGKPVMVDFYADWCASCKIMERTTLQNPQVRLALNNFVLIKADVTANDADANALLNYLNVVAPPTFLFFNQKGKELTLLRLFGEVSPQVFYGHLRKTLNS